MAWFIPALVAALSSAAATGGAAAGRKIFGTGQPEPRPSMSGVMRGGSPKLASQHPISAMPMPQMRVITLAELLGVQPASPPTQRPGSMSMLNLLGGR